MTEPGTGTESGTAARRPRWADVAVLGLVVTLAFNTLGVWFQLDQSRQSKEVTQVGLVTELHALAAESEAKINATDAPDLRCEPDQINQLRDAEQAAVAAALDNYDYLAWLLDRHHLTLSDADGYLAPRMIDAYRLGAAFMTRRYLSESFPYLKRFRDRAPKQWVPVDVCAGRH